MIKVPLPPTFSGESVGKDQVVIPIRSWRQDVYEYLLHQNCSAENLVSSAKRFLVGHAKNAFMSHESMRNQQVAKLVALTGAPPPPPDWTWFCNLTDELFGNLDPEQVARDSLHNLVQTGTLESYLQKFQGYVDQLTTFPLSEGDLIDRF